VRRSNGLPLISAWVWSAAAEAVAVASSALRGQLHGQDAVLGPWVPGSDPLEDSLNAFSGAPGGPTHHPWEAGLGFGGTLSDAAAGEQQAQGPAWASGPLFFSSVPAAILQCTPEHL
jgi:hypothetical protein